MYLTYFCIAISCACAIAAPTTKTVDFLMPEVQPQKPDTYLCRSIDVGELQPYITEFIPKANQDIAHHILLYGCTEPGRQDKDAVWNCGEMAASKSHFDSGPVCASGSQIMYAWAMDAPSLRLPKDVAFKVGGDTSIKKLTLQIHYKNVSSFLPPENKKDSSGLTLVTTNEPKARRAGVYLVLTGGSIPAHSIEYLEAACPFPDSELEIHPFAFRTHAHSLGRVISGYRVRDGQWVEIGRQDPRKPQMFYNVTDPTVTVKKGDILVARCTMENNLDHSVAIGPTQDDEMCNFYIMYYVDGDKALSRDMCTKPGPPIWYLEDYPDQAALNLNSMPISASTVPDTGRVLVATTDASDELSEPKELDRMESIERKDPELDELLDNFIADMDSEDLDALMTEVLQEQEAPVSGRAARLTEYMPEAFGYYYPKEAQ